MSPWWFAEECRHVKGFDTSWDSDLRSVLGSDMKSAMLHDGHRHRMSGTTSLKSYLYETNDATWEGFENSFDRTLQELKCGRKDPRRHVFRRLRSAYEGIVWPEFSIDLVGACLRQMSFTTKMVHNSAMHLPSETALSTALLRYSKFLNLMKNSKTNIGFVPTLDIDLCWHTHQLFPVSYRAWCIEHIGRAVNHDDSIGKGSLLEGLRSTSIEWRETYHEGYVTCDLRKGYLTRVRKIVGIVFPPYGLFILLVGRKLSKASVCTMQPIERSLINRSEIDDSIRKHPGPRL